MSNLQTTPVETLHHIATLAEQLAQQARRGQQPFIAYLLSMASNEAREELRKAGYSLPPVRAERVADTTH